MPEPGQLSVNDRVLLHISRFATDIQPEEYPPDCTQAGIAVAVGISRTHVPRAVKGLMKDGLVTELTARVRGHERRMSIYVVSPEGLAAAEKLWQAVQAQEFSVLKDETVVRMTGRRIEDLVGRKRALTAVSQMRDGVLTIDGRRRSPVRDLRDAPHIDKFYGRSEELERMDAFMDSDARVLVVLGNRGYGTTALVRKFVESQDEEDVLWMCLGEDSSAEDIESRLIGFGRKIDGELSDIKGVLGLDNALLVFDDYFSVPEEVVELFGWLVENADDAKVMISARQETPAYNWFYQRKHVDLGVVQELRIKGLDASSARKLLGNDKIEEDALRRIMMMTHGQPMVLRMLRENDEKSLRKNTLFTPEEIRYLLFLKDKTE
jgi:DNA-binding MarR family transcriptional regulator